MTKKFVLLVVLGLVALALVSGIAQAQAIDTLISFTVGCSGFTYTFSTTDETTFEAHHHINDVANDYDLTEGGPYHYMPVSGAGTHTLYVPYEYTLPQGSLVFVSELHLHGQGNHPYLLDDTFPCSDAPPAGPTCGLPIPAGSVVGSAPHGGQIYWAPGKMSPGLTLNPGTYIVIGQDESETYYKIVLACQTVWVLKSDMGPSNLPPQNGAPLPTRIVG